MKKLMMILSCLNCFGLLFSQEYNEGVSFNLSSGISGNLSRTYVASSQVSLIPGFSYQPTTATNNSFSAFINTTITPPAENITGGPGGDYPGLNDGVVGTLPASYDVSSVGSFTYHIPIEIPAELGNLISAVSLDYNSENQDGIAGNGWGLSGLSVISRSHSKIYNSSNAKIRAISYTDNGDQFYMDGSFLQVTNTVNGGKPTNFTIENVPNIVIVAEYEGSILKGFRSCHPDGKIYYYGYDNKARENNAEGISLRWYLYKIEDFDGNYAVYNYQDAAVERLLTSIVYYKKNGTSYVELTSIQFQYAARSRKYSGYLAGVKSETKSRLTGVVVKEGTTILKNYALSYAAPSGSYPNDLLASVTLNGKNTTHFNPTFFNYSNYLPSQVNYIPDWLEFSPGIMTAGLQNSVIGDINNDGVEDMIYLDNVLKTKLGLNNTVNWISKTTSVVFNQGFIGDLNGDGLNEVVFYKSGKTTYPVYYNGKMSNISANAVKNGIYLYKWDNQSGNLVQVTQLQFDIQTSTSNIAFGDFNGDFRTDILLYYYDSGSKKYYERLYFGANTGSYISSGYSSQIDLAGTPMISDFNGDGKSDIMVVTAENASIYSLDDNNSFVLINATNQLKGAYSYMLGDFNGDKLTDVLEYYPGSFFRLYRSTGVSFINDGESASGYYPKTVGDVNFDGKTDLITLTSFDMVTGYWKLAVFNHLGTTGLSKTKEMNITVLDHSWDRNRTEYPPNILDMQLADFDGNGKQELNLIYRDYLRYTPVEYPIDPVYIVWKWTDTYAYWTATNPMQVGYPYDFIARFVTPIGDLIADEMQPKKLSKVIDGYNNTMQISYAPMVSLYGTYTDDENTSSGQFTFTKKIPFPCVKQIVLKDILKSDYTLSYKYSPVGFAIEGQGLLGVKYWSQTNSLRKEVTEKRYNYFTELDVRRIFPHMKQMDINVNGSLSYKETHKAGCFLYNENQFGYSYIKESFIKNGMDDIENTIANEYREVIFAGNKLFGSMDANVNHFILLTKSTKRNRYVHLETREYDYRLTSRFNSSYVPAIVIQPYSDVFIREKLSGTDPKHIVERRYTYPSNFLIANRVQMLVTTNLYESGVNRIPDVSSRVVNEYEYYDVPANTNFGKLKREYKRGSNDPVNVADPELKPVPGGVKTYSSLYEYSASGRSPKVVKEEQSLKYTEYIYDEMLGLVTSSKDVQGTLQLTTLYAYDDFGRNTQITFPDGRMSYSALRWANGMGPQGSLYYLYSRTTGDAFVKSWFTCNEKVIRKEQGSFGGNILNIDASYNAKGLLISQSDPYFASGSPAGSTTYVYDDFGRELKKTLPSADMITTSYTATNGEHIITETTPRKTTIKKFNESNELIVTTDVDQTVTNTYYADGNLKQATPSTGPSVTFEYNRQGKRTKLTDPDAGTTIFSYNALGELLSEQDARGIKTVKTYDAAGRISTLKHGTDGLITYSYYSSGYIGLLNKISSASHIITYEYNPLGMIAKKTEEVDVVANKKTFITQYTYELGRLVKQIYPSGYYITNHYDEFGNLTKIRSLDQLNVWELKGLNAYGQQSNCIQGNNISTQFTYDTRHMPASIVAGSNIVNMWYNFKSNGDLNYRWDKYTQQREMFAYDNYNRLTHWNIYNISDDFSMPKKQNSNVYDAGGNIIYKSELSGGTSSFDINYGENNYPPHAVTSIVDGNSLLNSSQEIIYNADGKFSHIHITNSGSGINKEYDVTYGVDDMRRKGVFKENNAVTLSRYYVGDFEQEFGASNNELRSIHYITNNSGLVAIYEIVNGVGTMYYTHTDYLGSILTITNQSGAVVERLNYDPWGNKRNPGDWTMADNRTSWKFYRGFTLHEHLDAFAIINMNGRIYDPQLGRFVSPDPQLQAPDFPQNFNRYAYAYNNPLIYTDPDGEWLWLIPVVINAVANVIIHWDDITDKSDGNSGFLEGLGYFVFGGVSGALSYAGLSGLSPVATGIGNMVFADNKSQELIAFYQTFTSLSGFITSQLSETIAASLSKKAKDAKVDEVVKNQIKNIQDETNKLLKKEILGDIKIPEPDFISKVASSFSTDFNKAFSLYEKNAENEKKKEEKFRADFLNNVLNSDKYKPKLNVPTYRPEILPLRRIPNLIFNI